MMNFIRAIYMLLRILKNPKEQAKSLTWINGSKEISRMIVLSDIWPHSYTSI